MAERRVLGFLSIEQDANGCFCFVLDTQGTQIRGYSVINSGDLGSTLQDLWKKVNEFLLARGLRSLSKTDDSIFKLAEDEIVNTVPPEPRQRD